MHKSWIESEWFHGNEIFPMNVLIIKIFHKIEKEGNEAELFNKQAIHSEQLFGFFPTEWFFPTFSMKKAKLIFSEANSTLF